MKRNLQTIAVAAAIGSSFLFGCSSPKVVDRTDPTRPSVVLAQEGYDTLGRKWSDQATQPVTPPVLSRNQSEILHVTGTITAIDYSTREVTLQDPQGRRETFVVDKSVQRLNEAKVGDKVSLDFYRGLNAEVRKPTAEEEQHPLAVLEATGRTGPEAAPAGSAMRQIRAVVTIEDLDRPSQTLTVKGPRGQYYVAHVADPSRLEQVHIGDTIVLTFTQSAAISLKPAGE